ncbi:MAG: winged helix-turn-helix domain-containing protein [Candidatus Micrarchaeota archaeon]
MKLNLSKLEILALQRLCGQEYAAGALSSALGVKKSFFSRLLKGLTEKGLVLTEKQGTEKLIRLSPASHAQSFMKLYHTRPNARIEHWLSGRSIELLIVVASSGEGADTKLILEECVCSRQTAYKIIRLLMGAGVISRNTEKGRIKITDSYVGDFASAYADNIQLLMQKEAKGFNVSVRVRKHVVLRTDAKDVPPYFSETGINALAKSGLEANLTSYSDYYFNLDGKKRDISLEEAFAHAMLLSTLPQHVDKPLLKIFYSKNKRKMNPRTLNTLAKRYLVMGIFDEIRRAAEDYEKMRDAV